MMQRLQKFGATMFVPVLLFSFADIVITLCSLFTNPLIFGSLAKEGTFWNRVWNVVVNGGWTVFNQVNLLFAVGLPIGLAHAAKGRVAMESLVIYLAFNYFVAGFLQYWGPFFGIDNYAKDLVANPTNDGLTMIAGIKTLDTSMIGVLLVAGIVICLHNHFFDRKLPDWLATFQGSTYVVMLGFFVMIPFAFLTCLVWSKIQLGIISMQIFIVHSGLVGVWIYTFLDRTPIPTGLHHLVYTPFQFGPAVVEGGLQPYWLKHLAESAQSSKPLSVLAPELDFQLYGNEKVFLVPAICYAFYVTTKESKRKQISALLIPTALISVFVGVMEPVDFIYLFAAPVLWVIYSLLSATMNTTVCAFGVVDNMTDGAIDIAAQDWIPLWPHHRQTYIIQFVTGFIFAIIVFFVFKCMILKFNYTTPSHEADDEDVRLLSKAKYKAKRAAEKAGSANASDPYIARASAYLGLSGGPSSIEDLTPCATRLRVTVVDTNKAASDSAFKQNKAVSVIHHGKALQVIAGLDITQVLERMQAMMQEQGHDSAASTKVDPTLERTTGFIDLLGSQSNIEKLMSCATRLRVTVVDPSLVADEIVFKQVGAYNLEVKDKEVDIAVGLETDDIIAKMREIM